MKAESILRYFFAAGAVLIISGACEDRSAVRPEMAVEPDLSNHPTYIEYDFSDENVIDFGIQPLWIPTSIITEAMKRDEVLKRTLSEKGLELRFHSFLKGADVNFFIRREDLEAGIGGDMPALTAAAVSDVQIGALIQYGFCAVVAKHHMMIKELRGKRIGYAFGSNAHYAILHSLSHADISESDVAMVPLDVNEMPDALDKDRIDAFIAWEPTPSIALTRFSDQVVVHRSISRGYLYFSRTFSMRYPEAVRHILAAEIRAIRWIQSKKQNLLSSCEWALEAANELHGKALDLNIEQLAALALEDIIGLVGYPIIPAKDLSQAGVLYAEYELLQSLGKIPLHIPWESTRKNFDIEIIKEIIMRSEEYCLSEFNYRVAKNND
jgi:NitT/TauT family transport system substrate-binding protein